MENGYIQRKVWDIPAMGEADSAELVEDIDVRRLNKQAYDYLCRLKEIRIWLSECLKDDVIPSETELEKNLRNGVLLARLGNSFAPDSVALQKIFDIKQERYNEDPEGKLMYRHTDNIMMWRRAMESVRLPEIFMPETTDVYDGRNQKTIFCLYALAFHLYRLRKAPPIRNLAGKAIFTNDVIAEMRDQIKDSNLPEFGNVGGMLTDKMTQDVNQTAIAIQEIEKSVEEKNSELVLKALQNPDAGILYVESKISDKYLDELVVVKERDGHLDKTTVQKTVTDTNHSSGVVRLNELLTSEGDVPIPVLLDILEWLQFEDVRENAIPLYLSMLREKRANTELTYEHVKAIVDEANALAEVKLATLQGSSLDVLSALRNPVLRLEVRDENARLYYNRLFYNYEKSAETFFLSRNDLQNIVYEFGDLSSADRNLLEVSAACERAEVDSVTILLKELCIDVYIEENVEYYIRKINKREKKALSLDDLRSMLKETNFEVARAFDDADLLVSLNQALLRQDTKTAQELLAKIDWHRDDSKHEFPSHYRQQLANWYARRLIGEIYERVNKEGVNSGDHVEEYFYHDFYLGTVYEEIETRTHTTKRKTPENVSFMRWQEFELLFAAENGAFDQYYSANEDAVKKSQNASRRFLEKKRQHKNDVEKQKRDQAAKLIQENYKKYIIRRDQEALKSSGAPSLTLVRKFVTYLQDRDYDVNEELEIEEKKSRVTQLVVSNRQLDSELQELDEKIGLLIKNRINLQDVIAHKDKISKDADSFAYRPFSMRKKDKDSTDKLEQLFFHLQADPAYLANLIQSNPRQDPNFDLISDGLGPVFGFLTEKREQFLMVRLLCELLLRDVESIKKPEKILHGSSVEFIKTVLHSSLFSSVNESVLPSLVGQLRLFMEDEGHMEAFNLNPADIFETIYGQKAPDINAAVQCPHVSQVLETSKDFLAKWSDNFITAITKDYQLPVSIRYLAIFLDDIIRRQFPSMPVLEVQKLVSEFVYDVFIRPQIVSVKLLSSALGREPSAEALGKLEVVSKFIEIAVGNKGYGNARWYLTSLNRQVHNLYEDFKKYTVSALTAQSADDLYGLNQFTHFNPSHKPTLTIMHAQLEKILKQCAANVDSIVPDPSNAIREIIRTSQSPSDSADRTIILHLHPMTNSGDPRKLDQELFVRTKKYVIDILLSGCVGSDIPELLSRSARQENEDIHRRLFNQGETFESIAEKQAAVQENLNKLEALKRVSDEDKYQAIVTDIANDIRLATRRRKERVEQRQSLESSETRLEMQRKELKERLTQYEVYLDTCLENLSRNARRLSFRPTSTKAEKIQKARTSLDTQTHNYKCTAEKLLKKGILNSVEGYENKKLGKLTVEISSTDKKGLFRVSMNEGKENVVGTVMDFQDLLQSQYAEDDKFNIGDVMHFSVNPFVAFMNKKFYSN